MEIIRRELDKYRIPSDSEIKVISNKEGIIACAVYTKDESYFLKYFENVEYRREITYYKLLNNLGVKTIKVIDSCKTSILLENIKSSNKYRLATKEDMNHPEVVKSLALWYKDLHTKGYNHLLENSDVEFYSEINLLTSDNVSMVRLKSGYDNDDFWYKFEKSLTSVQEYIKKNKTLTYNDFYYVNMVVSNDLKEAFMFDYNLLGEGLKYFDVRNVSYWLTDDNKNLFLQNYGTYNENEVLINDILSPIIGLVIAYRREIFPDWAESDRNDLLSGNLLKKLENFLLRDIQIKS